MNPNLFLKNISTFFYNFCNAILYEAIVSAPGILFVKDSILLD